MAGLAYGLCKALNLEKFSKEGTGIFLVAAIAGIIPTGFAYGANLFMIEAYWSSVIETHIGWSEFTFFMIPYMIYFALAVVLVIFMYRSKRDLDSKAYAAAELEKLGKMTANEKKAIAWLILMFSYVIYTGFTGGDCTFAFILIPGFMLLPLGWLRHRRKCKKFGFNLYSVCGQLYDYRLRGRRLRIWRAGQCIICTGGRKFHTNHAGYYPLCR